MDRRKFFALLGAGAGGAALERVIPLGRVWSFPKNIVLAGAPPAPPVSLYYGVDWGFGVSQSVLTREYWQRRPNGEIWMRREALSPRTLKVTEIHGWKLTGYAHLPIEAVTPEDHRPSRLLSS